MGHMWDTVDGCEIPIASCVFGGQNPMIYRLKKQSVWWCRNSQPSTVSSNIMKLQLYCDWNQRNCNCYMFEEVVRFFQSFTKPWNNGSCTCIPTNKPLICHMYMHVLNIVIDWECYMLRAGCGYLSNTIIMILSIVIQPNKWERTTRKFRSVCILYWWLSHSRPVWWRVKIRLESQPWWSVLNSFMLWVPER